MVGGLLVVQMSDTIHPPGCLANWPQRSGRQVLLEKSMVIGRIGIFLITFQHVYCSSQTMGATSSSHALCLYSTMCFDQCNAWPQIGSVQHRSLLSSAAKWGVYSRPLCLQHMKHISHASEIKGKGMWWWGTTQCKYIGYLLLAHPCNNNFL